MNALILYFLFLLQLKKFKGKSSEYNDCIDPTKIISDSSSCLNIKIPYSDNYTCCSMKITYNYSTSYNCFALENNYLINQSVLNEYISERNISSLFNLLGGNLEIDCGNNLKIQEIYQQSSEEYLNCYQYHIQGIENKDGCISIDIPDGSKCCYVETSTQNNFGDIINDTRCYVIPKIYFEDGKNLENYVLDLSNKNNLNEIENNNITINCKNTEPFILQNSKKSETIIGSDYEIILSFISENSENNESNVINDSNDSSESNERNDSSESSSRVGRGGKKKSKIWLIVLIVIIIILLIVIPIFIIFYFRKKKTHTPIKTIETTNGLESVKTVYP